MEATLEREYYEESERGHALYAETLRKVTEGLTDSLGATRRGALPITITLTLSQAMTMLGAVAASACGASLTTYFRDDAEDVVAHLSQEVIKGAIIATLTAEECSTWNIRKGTE